MNELKYQRKSKYYLSSTFIKVLLVWFIIIISIIQASGSTVATSGSTVIDAKTVSMQGFLVLTDPSIDVWFEYGGTPGHYIYKTDPRTLDTGGFYGITEAGLPLQAHQTYYFRAVGDAGGGLLYGTELSFTMADLTETETRFNNFSGHLDELVSARLNITQTTTTLPKPYTDIMGGIFWGVAFGFIFVMIFLRQEDIGIPALLGLLIGSFLFVLLPPEWVQTAYMMLIVSFGALAFSLIKGRG